jgi:hypothetical protein
MEHQGEYWDLEQCRWVHYVAPDHIVEFPEPRTSVEEDQEAVVRSG